jgi:predicted DNA-binding antitoxin AbrB/MazE fold protein
MTVHAIYENGVFRPTQHVDLPEKTTVEFEPRVVLSDEEDAAAQRRIYELLSRSYDTGQTDTAARHNEHQP